MKNKLSVILIVILMAGCISAQSDKKYEQPILITSAGQSADVTLAGMLFKKAGINYKIEALAKENHLDGVKTLVIIPGFSSKGLGAAGISRDQEKARINALILAAKKKNIKIIVVHIGGTARRGQQSDDFNQLSAEASSDMVIVKQGDEDQFFTKIANSKKIKISLVNKMSDVSNELKKLF